ncbi:MULTISPECIES: transposase [Streptomyces]|uniref:transposase n=1 Tax=Streptomyces TaxID=1883 RepID=UPI001F0DA051|nr:MULTISPECIES: transposase [Streptomyces]
MLDAIRYLVAGGISWRSMPVDFPGWDRVYAFFRRGRQHGLITEFHDRLRDRVRVREGREAEPTAGIIDAQSVKAAATVPAGSRGYDGGKQINGRKRHIVTDCLGLPSEELPQGHRPGHQRGLTTGHVQAYRPGRAPESTRKPGHAGHAGNYLCAVRRTGGAS